MPKQRMLRYPAWLFIVFAFALSVSAGEEETITVSVNASNQMTVPVKVNGQDALSVIDTAATIALIDEDLLPTEDVLAERPEIVVQGLSDTITYETTEIGLVEVGIESLRAVPAGIIRGDDFPSHKAVIPANAFPQRVIDFNFQAGEIVLYDRQPFAPQPHLVSRMAYDTVEDLIFIPIEINGRRGSALIDTGADSSFINGKFADLARARKRPDLEKVLVGVDLEKTPVRVVTLRRVQIGQYRVDDYNLLALDPDLFSALGLEDEPVMLLGMDVLRHFRLQIDREKEKVLISRVDRTYR